MSTVQAPVRFVKEFAEYLASAPNEDELLSFRPSKAAQKRASELLAKQNAGATTPQEQRELDQFYDLEMVMRFVKAQIHAKRAQQA